MARGTKGRRSAARVYAKRYLTLVTRHNQPDGKLGGENRLARCRVSLINIHSNNHAG
jgi:hypothetical protein